MGNRKARNRDVKNTPATHNKAKPSTAARPMPEEPVLWGIGLTPDAQSMFEAIQDKRVRSIISSRITELTTNPEQQGKPLRGELALCRSVRAVGQRYRIVYKIEHAKVLVLVIALGLRKAGDKKDIYTLTQRLVRLGLLGGASDC